MQASEQSSLFSIVGLPKLQADETLYNWCGRFHRISGNVDPKTTSRQLFGHPTAGLRHDLPCNLDFLDRGVGGALGPLDALIWHRTHLALFHPFLDEPERIAVEAALRGRGPSKVFHHLGLTKASGDLAPRLKVCLDCHANDRLIVPTGWWRMEHQHLPVRVCLRHQRLLTELDVSPTRYGMADWYLPTSLYTIGQLSSALGPEAANVLARIATWTAGLLSTPDLVLTSEGLRATYLLQARKRGWIALDGSLRFAALKSALLEHYDTVLETPGLNFLKEATKLNGGFVGLAFRQYPGKRHPIKHIYLIAFLFEDLAEFIQLYRDTELEIKNEGPAVVESKLRIARDTLIAKVTDEGSSVNAACSALGIAPVQAIRLFNKLGITYQRRPRVLTPELKKRLDAMLRAGADRERIAEKLGVRKAFIKDYLAKSPELRDLWTAAYARRQTKSYREHFLNVLRTNPGVPIKRIRAIPDNGFDWLYRNDRDWLVKVLPAIWQRPEENN